MFSTARHLIVVTGLALAAGCDTSPPLLYGDVVQRVASDGGTNSKGSCDNIVGDRTQQVCLRWNCDRANRDEGGFSGNIMACMPGTPDMTAQTNALRILNLYRFIADLPPVTNDDAHATKAQTCSLMMDANQKLSHMPPMDWLCYAAIGAEAAGSSNISSASAVVSIDMYMKDFGNATTLGHRRWLLSNGLGPVGIGSAPKGSCLWVIGGSGKATKQWMAWPPPGPVPIGIFNAGPGGEFDVVGGWSVQSDSIDLSKASVSVLRDKTDTLNVDTVQLLPNYGAAHAIRFNPNGWVTQAGHTYHVSVGGVTPAIEYDVQVEACPMTPPI